MTALGKISMESSTLNSDGHIVEIQSSVAKCLEDSAIPLSDIIQSYISPTYARYITAARCCGVMHNNIAKTSNGISTGIQSARCLFRWIIPQL